MFGLHKTIRDITCYIVKKLYTIYRKNVRGLSGVRILFLHWKLNKHHM